MEAAERTISQILTEQFRCPYSWEKGNVEQLLDDVWEACITNDEEYFIGSLITIEREKSRVCDVVDGQQRLICIYWSRSALRMDSGSSVVANFLRCSLPEREGGHGHE